MPLVGFISITAELGLLTRIEHAAIMCVTFYERMEWTFESRMFTFYNNCCLKYPSDRSQQTLEHQKVNNISAFEHCGGQ